MRRAQYKTGQGERSEEFTESECAQKKRTMIKDIRNIRERDPEQQEGMRADLEKCFLSAVCEETISCEKPSLSDNRAELI